MGNFAVHFTVDALQRLLISADTVDALSSSYVSGSSGHDQARLIRMYYESTDAVVEYAGTDNDWNRIWSYYINPESALGPLLNSGCSWAWRAWMPSRVGWISSFSDPVHTG